MHVVYVQPAIAYYLMVLLLNILLFLTCACVLYQLLQKNYVDLFIHKFDVFHKIHAVFNVKTASEILSCSVMF